MLTSSNSTSIGATFMKAPNDSLFGKVFRNNMDSNSFSSDTNKQISLTILNGRTAIFQMHTAIVAEQEYTNCQVNKNSKENFVRISCYFKIMCFQIERVWRNKYGLNQGIPMTKGLPYGIFMRHIIFQMTETGQLNKLLKQWSVPEHNCSPLHKEGKSLGLEKMISLFIISVIGISIGFIILIIEKICHDYEPIRHVSIKELNKMKLQRSFLKFQESLNEDKVFLSSTMRTLMEDMQYHNDLLKGDSKFTEGIHDSKKGREIKN